MKLPISKSSIKIGDMTPFVHVVDRDGVVLFQYRGKADEAEFIVKACNAHEQLVEALKKCINAIENLDPQAGIPIGYEQLIEAGNNACFELSAAGEV